MTDNPSGPTPIETPGGVDIHRQRISYLGWKPDKPDVRDFHMAVHYAAGAADVPKAFLPGAATLLPPIRDQGEQGSCGGHSMRSAVQYKLAQEKGSAPELAPRFIYYNARLIEGTTSQDAGLEIRDAAKAVGKLGVSTEALCPYNDKVFAQRPSAAAYKEALGDLVTNYQRVPQNHNAIKQCILAGNPIVFGFTVYENFMDDQTAKDGLMAQPEGSVDGGHAIWMCGFDDTINIRGHIGGCCIGNSWGKDWGAVGANGSRGYFWMPWNLVTNPNFADDFWAINVVK